MFKKERYSEWEYDEEGANQSEEEQPTGEDSEDSNDADDGSEDGGGEPAIKKIPSDDDAVAFTLPDGTEVTKEEAKKGYMRQQDYTRKTQELSQSQQLKEEEKAKKVVDNPEEYSPEDVNTAEHFLKILKNKFGVMTREEFEAENSKREFQTKLESDLGRVDQEAEKLGVKSPERIELLKYMQDNQIHSAMAAFKLMKEDEIFQAKLAKAQGGKKHYETEKKGVRTTSKDGKKKSVSEMLDDEIEKMDTENEV